MKKVTIAILGIVTASVSALADDSPANTVFDACQVSVHEYNEYQEIMLKNFANITYYYSIVEGMKFTTDTNGTVQVSSTRLFSTPSSMFFYNRSGAERALDRLIKQKVCPSSGQTPVPAYVSGNTSKAQGLVSGESLQGANSDEEVKADTTNSGAN